MLSFENKLIDWIYTYLFFLEVFVIYMINLTYKYPGYASININDLLNQVTSDS